MSRNVVPLGEGIAILHRYQENDEIYVIDGGRGQFLVDGECINVAEGTVLRIGSAAARAWRNDSDTSLYFLYIPYRADNVIQGEIGGGWREILTYNRRGKVMTRPPSCPMDPLPSRK